MRRFVLVTSTFAALAALLPVRTRAADLAPIRLETLVSGKSLAFASVEQVGSLGTRFKATALGKMLDDPEMKGFAAPVAEDLKKLMQDKDGKSGLPIPPMALELLGKLTGLEGQAAVALVDVADHKPVLAACLDFGGHLSDFVTFLTRVKDDPSGDKPPLQSKEEGGHTWWTMGDPEHPEVFATTLGTALFVSTDRAWLAATATANLAPVDGSLAASAPFQRVRAASGGDGARPLRLRERPLDPRARERAGEREADHGRARPRRRRGGGLRHGVRRRRDPRLDRRRRARDRPRDHDADAHEARDPLGPRLGALDRLLLRRGVLRLRRLPPEAARHARPDRPRHVEGGRAHARRR